MIGRLNHIAIVVPDLEAASALYQNQFGADISEQVALPEHGVITVFVNLPNTKIELLHPIGIDSPIAKFLVNHPHGGMHHLCYEVDDIAVAVKKLAADGMRILGDGQPKIGAHGKPVIFLHPKDGLGTLIELEEV